MTADAASIDLSRLEIARIRQLLFYELKQTAEALAEQAHGAAEGNTNRDNIAGDDAYGTCRHRLQPVAELLDKFGWSVLNDTATIVESERQQERIARFRREQEGE